MDNLNLSYRQFHETFMQNHTGTSIEETIIVQTAIPFATFISICVVHWVKRHEQLLSFCNFNIIQFFIEFAIMVVSQILLFTLPEYNSYLYMFIYGVGFCIIFVILLDYRNETAEKKERSRSLRKVLFTGKRPYISGFRSSVNLATTVCILAVDFTSFPRKFAKTETFGFSVMDLGVGYFVVCSALVGWHNYKSDSNKPAESTLFVQFKRSFPLLLLGLLRICFTRSTDYQSHNTEYGVHWNFFLTLIFVRLFSTALLRNITLCYVKYLAVAIITVHQLVLLSGIQDWVLSDTPRDTLINANREGIVSITGYVGLYILSVEIRNLLLRKSSTFEEEIKLLIKLIVIVIVLYPTVLLSNYYLPCSRRLVNVTYIAFVIFLSLYLLSLALFFELLLVILSGFKSTKNHSRFIPRLLESINQNALSYFLFANLLTGIVNLSIKTLYVSTGYSVCILILYMFTSCSIITLLYYKNYKIM